MAFVDPRVDADRIVLAAVFVGILVDADGRGVERFVPPLGAAVGDGSVTESGVGGVGRTGAVAASSTEAAPSMASPVAVAAVLALTSTAVIVSETTARTAAALTAVPIVRVWWTTFWVSARTPPAMSAKAWVARSDAWVPAASTRWPAVGGCCPSRFRRRNAPKAPRSAAVAARSGAAMSGSIRR